MKKTWIAAVAVAAGVLLASAPSGATVGGDPRDPFENRRGNIYTEAGLSTDAGPAVNRDSVDPKSNSLAFSSGDYLTFHGYWHDPSVGRTLRASDAQLKLSWKGTLSGGNPRINVFLSDEAGNFTGEYLFLHPAMCSGAKNKKGWATSNFGAAGASCTIEDHTGALFTGTNKTAGDDGLWGTGDDVAATRAMDAALEGKAGQFVYFAYVLNDNPEGAPTVLLDRITFGGNILTKFR